MTSCVHQASYIIMFLKNWEKVKWTKIGEWYGHAIKFVIFECDTVTNYAIMHNPFNII